MRILNFSFHFRPLRTPSLIVLKSSSITSVLANPYQGHIYDTFRNYFCRWQSGSIIKRNCII